MHRRTAWIAAGAALVLTGAACPALAGDWRHDRAPWYDQHPWTETGVGTYYSQHPDHVPSYPHRLAGYAVPIYTVTTAVPAVRRHRLADAHVAWCAERYRSYDLRSDTYRPLHGARRQCRSPYS